MIRTNERQPFSARVKHLGYVMLAQMVCVGFGLWMQNHYVASSLYRASEEHAWQELSDAGGIIIESMLGPQYGQEQLDARSNEDVSALVKSIQDNRSCGVLLTDARGRVLATTAPERAPHNSPPLPPLGKGGMMVEPVDSSDRDVEFKAVAAAASSTAISTRGRFDLSDEEHLAVAWPVDHGQGRLIVHRSLQTIHEAAAAMTESLPLAAIMSWLWTCALLGISMYMIVTRFLERNDRKLAETESKSLQRIQTLVRTRDAVIFGLAQLADSRDPETGDHLERIAIYSSTLASALRNHPRLGTLVTPTFVRLIGISSALHDIGKVGIEDAVLRKPGPLTADERARMQEHTNIAGECLLEIERRLGRSNFLQMAREIAMAHHERWDGRGYPRGLKGEEIPLAARIVSIADVYDALSSRRVYKAPCPHGDCVEEIRKGAGTQFDPDLVEIWLGIADQFQDMAQRYAGDTRPNTLSGREASIPPTDREEPTPLWAGASMD